MVNALNVSTAYKRAASWFFKAETWSMITANVDEKVAS